MDRTIRSTIKKETVIIFSKEDIKKAEEFSFFVSGLFGTLHAASVLADELGSSICVGKAITDISYVLDTIKKDGMLTFTKKTENESAG